jgi:hypothetical protein
VVAARKKNFGNAVGDQCFKFWVRVKKCTDRVLHIWCRKLFLELDADPGEGGRKKLFDVGGKNGVTENDRSSFDYPGPEETEKLG